jgi:hypothetical protein
LEIHTISEVLDNTVEIEQSPRIPNILPKKRFCENCKAMVQFKVVVDKVQYWVILLKVKDNNGVKEQLVVQYVCKATDTDCKKLVMV